MRIALAGSGLLAEKLFEALRGSKHEVVALIQNGRAVQNWGRRAAAMKARLRLPGRSVIKMAGRAGAPIVWIDKMDEEELAPLRAIGPDLILVGGFSIILKPPLLGLPRIGCVNTHSSLLPRHRGPNPFTAVILSGDTETGVTFHIMEPGIDTGPIVAQYPVAVPPDADARAVFTETAKLAGARVCEVMDRIEAEGLHGEPQDESQATYEKAPRLPDTFLYWTEPAADLERRVRALYPIMPARVLYKGHTIRVLRAKAEAADTARDAPPGAVLPSRYGLRVATGAGALHIQTAVATFPVPWLWPNVFSRPKPGEMLE